MIVYTTSESNLVCDKRKRVKDPTGFSYKFKTCDVCTNYVRAYNASKRGLLKQYRRTYYVKKYELLGMRVRQDRWRDDRE